jgi:hypothetical protein
MKARVLADDARSATLFCSQPTGSACAANTREARIAAAGRLCFKKSMAAILRRRWRRDKPRLKLTEALSTSCPTKHPA